MASHISRGRAASTSHKRFAAPGGALLVSVIMMTTLGGTNPAAATCGVTSATHSTGVHAASSGTGGIHTGASTPHVSSAGESCPTSTASTAHIAGLTGGLAGGHMVHALNAGGGHSHMGHENKAEHTKL